MLKEFVRIATGQRQLGTGIWVLKFTAQIVVILHFTQRRDKIYIANFIMRIL